MPHSARSRIALTIHTLFLSSLIGIPGLNAISILHAAELNRVAYDVPAGTLEDALNVYAKQSGVTLSFDPALVKGKSAPAVKGEVTKDEALSKLLKGSGLQPETKDGTVVIKPVPISTQADTLPEVAVNADRGYPEVKAFGELSKPFAGNQVATGAGLRMLGNADVMTTPFSVKSYTNELIMNQGARSMDDVVANDPSIRVSLSPGFVLDQSSIRGFVINAAAYTLDGLPGMVSYSRIPVQNFERVEIFKGPTSALGGASVSGTSVGGSINLVPKRAMATPNASATVGYSEKSMYETQIDLGRRFGESQQFGVRFNVYGETGDMISGTERDNLAPQIALDYKGDKFRATWDAGLINYKNRKPGVNHSLGIGQTLPDAPKNGRAAQPDTAQQALDGRWSIVGAEYDFTPQLTAYAKYGTYYEESVDSYVATIEGLRSDGTFNIPNYVYNSWKTHQDSKEFGLRTTFETGPVKHQASLSSLSFHRLYTAPSRQQSTRINTTSVIGNIYSDYANPYSNNRPALGPYLGPDIDQDSVAIADSMTLLDDKLNVIIGLRHQRIEQDATPTSQASNEKKNTPTVAGSYQLVGGWTVYGNYAEQLTQGTLVTDNTARNVGEILAPFVGKQHEVGAKWNAGNYGLTLAYFDIRQPSSFKDPADNIFKESGEQRNKGLEVETFGEIMDGVRLLGGVAYIDARQTKTQGGATDGKRALGVAEVNVNLGAEVDISAIPGLTLTGRFIHTGDSYINLANTQRLPSWNRLDIGARYLTKFNDKTLILRTWISNVTDEEYWMSGGRNLFVVAEPRTWRVSATLNF